MVSEPLFETLGDKIVGFFNNVGYDVEGDNELNQEFVEAYTEDHGSPPYYVPADNYLAAETLFAGRQEGRQRRPGRGLRRPGDLSFDCITGEVTCAQGPPAAARLSYLGQVVDDGGLKFST